MTDERRLQVRGITVTREEMRMWSKRVVDALNDMQFIDHLTLDQTLMVVLYTIGATCKSRGLVIDVNRPLLSTLPPLADGYLHAKMPIKRHSADMGDAERIATAAQARDNTEKEATATVAGEPIPDSPMMSPTYNLNSRADVKQLATDIGQSFCEQVMTVTNPLPLELRVLFYSFLFLPSMGGMMGSIGPAAAKAVMDYGKGMVDASRPSPAESTMDEPAMAAFTAAIAVESAEESTVVVVQDDRGGSAAYSIKNDVEVQRLGHAIGRSWMREIQGLVQQLPEEFRQTFFAAAFSPAYGSMLSAMGLERSTEVLQTGQRILVDIDSAPMSPTKH